MPPVAIMAAATIGSAAIGAGANIAAAGANASAARSAAAANAATINANKTDNRQLISDLQQGNQGRYDQAFGASNAAAGNAFDQTNTGLFDTANRNFGYADNLQQQGNGIADTLQGQGQGLYQATADRGNAAGSAISSLLGLGGDAAGQEQAFKTWLGSTGYKFTQQAGADAVSSNATTKGLLGSGGTLKALNNYGQQTGQTYFGNYLSGLQNQQSTGLTAANALSGVYGNVAGMRNAAAVDSANLHTSANNALGAGYTANQNNLASSLSGNAWNYAGGLSAQQTAATDNLVSGNTQATNALVGNANNALGQTISSNNATANGISGAVGNAASAYGYAQGQSSYGGQQQNPLAMPIPGAIDPRGGPAIAAQTLPNLGQGLSSYSPTLRF